MPVNSTKRGTVSLHGEFTSAPDTKHLEVRICDTGIGMQPDQLQTLFEPFVQADASTSRRYGAWTCHKSPLLPDAWRRSFGFHSSRSRFAFLNANSIFGSRFRRGCAWSRS